MKLLKSTKNHRKRDKYVERTVSAPKGKRRVNFSPPDDSVTWNDSLQNDSDLEYAHKDETIHDETTAAFNHNCWHHGIRHHLLDDGEESFEFPKDTWHWNRGVLGYSNVQSAKRNVTIDHFDDVLLPSLSFNRNYDLGFSEEEICTAFVESLPTPSSLSGNFTFGNFVYELRELSSLLSWCRPKIDPLKRLAKGHLTWSFGVNPLARDLQTIFDKLLNLDRIVEKWNSDARKGVVYTFHANIRDDVETHSDIIYIDHDPSEFYRDYTRVAYDQIDVCRLHSYLKPQFINWEKNEWNYRFKAAGLDKPLTTLWNAIPFTFVIDWFTNIGEKIENYERDTELLSFSLMDLQISRNQRIKAHYYDTQMQAYNENTLAWNRAQQLSTCKSEAFNYRRQRIHPPRASLSLSPKELEWKVPSLRQWFLGASLIVANTK